MQDLNDKVNNGGASSAGKLFHTDWNEVASEVQSIIADAGITLSSANLTQLLAAVAQLSRGRSFWCTDSGSGTAYVLTGLSSATITLFTGMTIKFRPANNNTVTNPTANFGGSGVKTITNEAGAPLVIGDLNVLRDAELRYDGTNWRLLNRCLTLTQTGLFEKGYINGYYLSNDTVAPNTTLVIGHGSAASDDALLKLIIATQYKKRIDAVWAAGSSSVGGRASAVSLTANTYYRVFVIGGATAATDVGFDTSAIATNLLSDATTITGNTYNKYRQIGWIRTDGSSNIVSFYMDLHDYTKIYWNTPYADISGTSPSDSRVVASVSAPIGSIAILCAWMGGNPSSTTSYALDIRPVAMSDIAASSSNFVLRGDGFGSGDFSDSTILECLVDGSRQIAYRFGLIAGGNLTGLEYAIITRGYVYVRS